jgi:hypothetical protein
MSQIKIPKKKIKGEDGYTSFSLRLPVELSDEINGLVNQTELSRNEFLTLLIKEAIKTVELVEPTENK